MTRKGFRHGLAPAFGVRTTTSTERKTIMLIRATFEIEMCDANADGCQCDGDPSPEAVTQAAEEIARLLPLLDADPLKGIMSARVTRIVKRDPVVE